LIVYATIILHSFESSNLQTVSANSIQSIDILMVII